MGTLDRMPFRAQKAVFKKLEEVADVASLSKEERELYDQRLKAYRDDLVTHDASRQEGYTRGLEDGMRKVARTMKARGMDTRQISELTGLSPEEIELLP